MLKPAKAICRQACADGADGFQGVYSDESAIFAKLYCNDHSFAPSDGGFRLEDSAALSSQGRTVLVPTKSRIQRISWVDCLFMWIYNSCVNLYAFFGWQKVPVSDYAIKYHSYVLYVYNYMEIDEISE